MVNEEYNKGFTKMDFLKKGRKAALSLGAGIRFNIPLKEIGVRHK
jgi:hypothetical protein